MQFTIREWLGLMTERTRVAIWLVVSAICAFSGPYYSHEAFGAVGVYAFWAGSIALGIGLAIAINLLMRSRFLNWHPVARIALLSVFFGAPYGSYIYVIVLLFYPPRWVAETTYLYTLIQASAIYAAVMLARHFLSKGSQPAAPALLERVQDRLGQDLIRVSSRDHYVEVTTAVGSELILMRFSDALNELADAEGLQVHRSQWVARNAVSDMVKTEGRVELRLSNGDLVPVSRSNRKKLDGLIRP